MHSLRLATIVLLASLWLLGCQPKKDASTAASNSVELARAEAQSLRESYRVIDQNIRVGVVLGVRPATRLAAVGDVAIRDFSTGQTLSFFPVGQPEQVVAHGTVMDIDTAADVLIVRYEEAPQGGRAPQEGDIAVRLQ